MTTKNFKHFVHYYGQFSKAFDLFSDSKVGGPSRDHIWKIICFNRYALSSLKFSLSPYVTPSIFIGCDFEPDSIVVERYSRVLFESDLKYFKSFVFNLSAYQLEVLKSDSRFTNLLNFIYEEKKNI